MQELKEYIISKQMMRMAGFRDRYGNMCTLVTEVDQSFVVDRSPLEILEDSIQSIGYDLNGARNAAKRILGHYHHQPILVNPIDRIVLFPTKSAHHEECAWFNPAHIKRTTSLYSKTLILFSNNETIIFPAKLYSFNDKIKRAEQLESLTREPFLLSTIVNRPSNRLRKIETDYQPQNKDDKFG